MITTVPRLLRPLPRQVKPFPSETIHSYLRRLAAANRLDADALRSHITGEKRRSAPFPIPSLTPDGGIRMRAGRFSFVLSALLRGRKLASIFLAFTVAVLAVAVLALYRQVGLLGRRWTLIPGGPLVIWPLARQCQG
jgi:hypothetical protein